ncbi:nuclear transport factor 2 family protein [bacterium]|nr:nuclear transport factor 2 family protein [bacterium]
MTIPKAFSMNYEEKIKNFFSGLSMTSMDLVDQFYDKNTNFIDPIGKHKGSDSVKAYYQNLYKNVEQISFEMNDYAQNGELVYMSWIMKLNLKDNPSKLIEVHGNSKFRFNEQGKALYHRDYFDMGEFIYEGIPVLGSVIKFIKKKLKNH